MMKIRISISLGILLVASISALAQANKTGATPTNTPQRAQAKTVPTESQRDGKQVFEQNCSRCHNAPEGFSSRISGTITRHMRVRAGLSEQDEQAILRFLNP
jgi:cytochrome c5